MESIFISYKQHRIHCQITGAGNVVICLHGLNMDGTMYKSEKIKNFLQDKTIIAVDLPGYGKSAFCEDLKIEDITIIINKIANHFNLKKFDVCGFCLGGIFALDYAIRENAKIQSLYLIETMIYFPWWLHFCRFSFFYLFYNFLNKNTLFLKVASLSSAFSGIEKKERFNVNGLRWNQKVNTFYLNMMRDYEKIDHIKRSKAIRSNLFIISSEKTFSMIEKTRKELLLSVQNSEFVRVTGKGHFIFS